MNTNRIILIIAMSSFFFLSCNENKSLNKGNEIQSLNGDQNSKNTLPPCNPFGTTVPCQCLEDQLYGNDPKQKYDIYLPQTSLPGNAPKSLVVYIHGGGFTGGDKQDVMNPTNNNAAVASLLNDGIAVASLNYRLLTPNDQVGIKKCINDCKDAINNILNNSTYNIDPSKIALWGSSAGAGISMLLGYDENYSINPKAIYVTLPQATYNITKWVNPNGIFPCSLNQLCPTITIDKLKRIYGLGMNNYSNCNQVLNAAGLYKSDVDILSKIDPNNEPPIWIENVNQNMNGGFNCNANIDILNHHKRHCNKLKNRANSQGLEWHLELFNIPITHGNGLAQSDAITFLKAKI